MTITIFYNAGCGASRNPLAMIRQNGEEPAVIEYLKTPPDRGRLVELIKSIGISTRRLLCEKATPIEEFDLSGPESADDEVIDFVLAHPILINRPIVEAPKGVRLRRPSELAQDMLPNPDIGPFVKEDGEVIINDAGKHIA